MQRMLQRRLSPLVAMAIALALATVNLTWAQGPAATSTPTPADSRRADTWEQLGGLLLAIDASRKELGLMRAQLRASKDELERKKLTQDIERLSAEVDRMGATFEKLAVGGVDVGLFAEQVTGGFDWRDELQDVFAPIVAELKRLTERPRKIEQLRSEQSHYQQRLEVAEAALAQIAELKQGLDSPAIEKEVAKLEERWRKRRDEMTGKLKLASFELEQTLAPPPSTGPTAGAALEKFFTGRGLDAVLAITAFLLVYLLLRYLAHLYTQAMLRRGRAARSFLGRIATLIFQSLSVIAALVAAMAVLYVRGDWILLGLLLILMLGAAWALKQSLPRYLNEARILLNIGSVREGERVIYNGLPWKIVTLNVFSTLHNPTLRGGTLRVPLDEMAQLTSRRGADDEPWFPSRENDFVLLEDETFGRVLAQTPEAVQLASGGAIKTYTVGAFLDKNPRNLTAQGFVVSFKFGFDYRHQREITETIPQRLAQYLRERIKTQPFGEHLSDLLVEYAEAAASSLDVLVVASFTGAAAERYFAIRRYLQRLIVEACNEYGWEIPFNQLTVHMAKSD